MARRIYHSFAAWLSVAGVAASIGILGRPIAKTAATEPVAATASATTPAERRPDRGKVVDGAGNTIQGARVSHSVSYIPEDSSAPPTTYVDWYAVTDEKGEFDLPTKYVYETQLSIAAEGYQDSMFGNSYRYRGSGVNDQRNLIFTVLKPGTDYLGT